MFWNGSTAIDGWSGSGSAVGAGATFGGAARPGRQCQTWIGRAMFLSVCVPPSSNAVSRRSRTSS